MSVIGISLAIPFTKSIGLFVRVILNDECVSYRKGERSGMYIIDYSDDCGVTWTLDLVQLQLNEDNIIITIDDGVAGYRHQIRGGAYCIDVELTPLGFAGVENIDWENVYYLIPE